MSTPSPADTWASQWPHYCRTCDGVGATYWEEHHDAGFPGEPMFEPCICVESNRCPRCGQHNDWPVDESHLICSHCGWDSEDPDFLPPEEYDPQLDLEFEP